MNQPVYAKEQLRSFVERVQRLDEEIKELNNDKRDIYAEAKGNGFDAVALKAVIAYLRKDPEKAEEQRELFDVYLANVSGTERATRAPAQTASHRSPKKTASINSAESTDTPSETKEPALSASPCADAAEPAKSLTVPAAASAGSLNTNARPEAEDVPEFLRRNPDNTVREEVRP